ncbi:hypothetical protein DFH09DRAFT_1089921 [Mycena vulgaris]|nr:hypothetical protein DFH09DRAFT_1089921 [Mycena vulgaris]
MTPRNERHEARGRNKGESAAGKEREDETMRTKGKEDPRPARHSTPPPRVYPRYHHHPRAPRPSTHRPASPGLRVPVPRSPPVPAPAPAAHIPHRLPLHRRARRARTTNKTTPNGQTEPGQGKERKEQETAERRKWGGRGMTRAGEKQKKNRTQQMRIAADGTRRRIRGHAVTQKRTDAAGARASTRPQGTHPCSASTPRTLDLRRKRARQRIGPVTRAHDRLRYLGTPRRGAMRGIRTGRRAPPSTPTGVRENDARKGSGELDERTEEKIRWRGSGRGEERQPQEATRKQRDARVASATRPHTSARARHPDAAVYGPTKARLVSQGRTSATRRYKPTTQHKTSRERPRTRARSAGGSLVCASMADKRPRRRPAGICDPCNRRWRRWKERGGEPGCEEKRAGAGKISRRHEKKRKTARKPPK